MKTSRRLEPGPEKLTHRYRFKILGRLDTRWVWDFEGFELSFQEGDSLLTGPVVDQAALHGWLARIRDLNWTLLSIERLEQNGCNSRGKEKT